MSRPYVDLAIPISVDRLFTYTVPNEFGEMLQQGMRVVAPFGDRTVTGFVVDFPQSTKVVKLKSILDVLDTEPAVSGELLDLSRWVAEYYSAPWGEVLKAILVRGSVPAGRRIVELIENPAGMDGATKKQSAILKELSRSGGLSLRQLQKKVGVKSVYHSVNALARRCIVKIRDEMPSRTPGPKRERGIVIDEAALATWRMWLETPAEQPSSRRSAGNVSLLRHLVTAELPGRFVPLTQLLKTTGATLSGIRSLQAKNVLTIAEREVIRTPGYENYPSALGATDITLNERQRTALECIVEAIASNRFHPFLLLGVTGSGKTQVYIEAIGEVLRRGKSAIVLVPEISLTPQIVRRFAFHFGDRVAVFHSRMSAGERFDAWRLAAEGRCSVVIGPRSAVFAPLKHLGLIVVDEEQEASYKQYDQLPRYHARDVAIMRASSAGAVVILGSATPSLESYSNAENGKYTLLELPERVDQAKLPKIEIVDVAAERRKKFELFREERRAAFKRDRAAAREAKVSFDAGSISDLLREKILDRLSRKEGIILLQNRRGFSPYLECAECGHVEMCEHCSISLTYHRTQRHLRCHYCGTIRMPPAECPACRSSELRYHGFGTQRVEEELDALFPEASVIRMDLDTTTGRGSHDRMLRKFSEGEADILLGTQMVAKGLDFSRVTLVGVISADTQMLLPDFRAAERTFQLLTQVAGRAGRSALPGEVVIQTSQPDHYGLRHVLTHDVKGFYAEELAIRKELNYPPFSRLILIECKGQKEEEVIAHASHVADLLKASRSRLSILGPAPASIARIRGFYRWHILLKSAKSTDPAGGALRGLLARTVAQYRSSPMGKKKSVTLTIDTDPIGMM